MRAIPQGRLLVSCQARADNPLHGPACMRAMALAAAAGGAGGIRAEGVADLAAIRAALDLPIIGLLKRWDTRFDVYITPRFADAAAIAPWCDVIALDATAGTRDGETVPVLIARIKAELGVSVMADIATLEEGLAAEAVGADYIGTTLAGYTPATRDRHDGPDLDLVSALVARCRVPVIAEGRYGTPAHVAEAFARGAHAVVVGTAITNPREITRGFAAAAPG
jgi:putative N-acetylmannosamine-6-phosphate epimerase